MEKHTTIVEKETSAQIELHNKEVTDLLGDPPKWLIRSGSYLLYGILLLFLSGASLISFPDVVRGTVFIDDLANVEWVTTKSSGQIETFFVENDSLVKYGDTICIMQNPALLDDVKKFCRILSNVELYYITKKTDFLRVFPFDLTMGEMSDAYGIFTKAVRTCLIYDDYNYFNQQKSFLQKELAILNRDSEKNELAIIKLEKEIFDLSISHKMELERNREQLELAYVNMVNSLKTWESKYLIQSQSEGRMVLGEVRILTRMVNKGDTLGSIISSHKEEFVARLQLEQEHIAGVEIGDPVNIRLAKYPEHTYGLLTGTVSSITYVPYNRHYTVDIIFPDQLKTTANKKIKYELELKGEAEIITSSRNVLSRIFDPIYSLFRKKDR